MNSHGNFKEMSDQSKHLIRDTLMDGRRIVASSQAILIIYSAKRTGVLDVSRHFNHFN